MVRVEDEDTKKVEKQLVKAGLVAVRDAKQNAPVDTGRLRASVTLADSTGLIERPGGEAQSGDGVQAPSGRGIRFGTNVEYARKVEEGTEDQRPQPFLVPAFRQGLARFDINTEGNI